MNTIVTELQDTVDSLTKIATLLSAADTDAGITDINHSEKIASTRFNTSRQETIKLDSKQVLNFLKFYL
jgi:hypothetical protein